MERIIKKLTEADLPQALALVWRVFSEFEAPEYSARGVEEFRAFIEQTSVTDVLHSGGLLLWGCYEGDQVLGVLGLRPPAHISLLFVDKEYHRQGIAKALLGRVLYSIGPDCRELTVNSSPYAVAAYEHMGFCATDTEQTVNGIRFIPMKCLLQ